MLIRLANLSILAGSILIAFACSVLLVGCLLFALGLTLSWFAVPLAGLVAAAFRSWVATCYFGGEKKIAFAAFHLLRTANLQHTLTWYYDSETKNAMRDVARYLSSSASQNKITIGNNWPSNRQSIFAARRAIMTG